MAIEWTKTLSTGLEWQDEQHQQLLGHVNDLLDAMERHEGPGELAKLLEFLTDYTDFHFKSEEGWMQRCKSPDYARHHKEHERLRAELAAHVAEHERLGPSTVVVMHVQNWMRNWIVNHISDEDQRLGAYAAKYHLEAIPPPEAIDAAN